MTDDAGEVIVEPSLGIFTIHSAETEKISEAFVAAQTEMEAVSTNSENTFFSRGNNPSRYADLAAVREGCIGPLNKHGIGVTQGLVPHNGGMLTFERVEVKKDRSGNYQEFRVNAQCMSDLQTILVHSSGQYFGFQVPIVCDWGDPQKVAATVTYMRRSSLASITGLAQKDDDGETERGRGNHREVNRGYQEADRGYREANQQRDAGNGQRTAPPAVQTPSTPSPTQAVNVKDSGGRRFFKWLMDNKKNYPDTPLIETASNISVDLGFGSHIVDLDEQQSRKVYTLLNDYLKEMAQAAPEEEVPA